MSSSPQTIQQSKRRRRRRSFAAFTRVSVKLEATLYQSVPSLVVLPVFGALPPVGWPPFSLTTNTTFFFMGSCNDFFYLGNDRGTRRKDSREVEGTADMVNWWRNLTISQCKLLSGEPLHKSLFKGPLSLGPSSIGHHALSASRVKAARFALCTICCAFRIRFRCCCFFKGAPQAQKSQQNGGNK